MKLCLRPSKSRIRSSMLSSFTIIWLVAVASAGWSEWAAAAACPSTDYVLQTQAELDAFGATGCDSVVGNLVVSGMTDANDLGGLSNLRSVGGRLSLSSLTKVNSLDGLNNLRSVGSDVSIEGNRRLENLSYLGRLTSIGGHLTIDGNPKLARIDGLSGLAKIGRALSIVDNKNFNYNLHFSKLTKIKSYK